MNLNIEKILDSNILIYSILEDHPASDVSEKLLLSCENKFTWTTSPITFLETFHVLIKIYGQDKSKTLHKIKEAMKSPLDIKPLNMQLIFSSLEKSIKHLIDTNDAILLQIAIDFGIPIIATDDKKLINACESYGIICENPINDNIRKHMSEWELKNLPKKGITRIYSNVYNWLQQIDKKIANKFKSETNSFTTTL